MKQQIKLLVVLGIILVGSFSFYLKVLKKDTLVYENNKIKPSSSGIAMMLETSAGSGNYEMTTRSEWPTEGYVLMQIYLNVKMVVSYHGIMIIKKCL